MRKYTDSHEWAEMLEDQTLVGITQEAKNELGQIVYIEFPKVGTIFKQGEEMAILESTKAATDIYAPLSGIVSEVNEVLRQNVNLLNDSPEKLGWLVKLKPNNLAEWDSLLDVEEYKKDFSQ
ncbi:MAG: glycine cleavage system protein H [Chlamydia sp. 32-24]|nr:MAG: glycine cleavage system protein H [Chlamydia sp. 32-24]